MTFTVRAITPDDARPLRLDVLRPGRPIEQAIFEGDDDPASLHLGAFEGTLLVGIASFYERPFPIAGTKSEWQLRGMAVAPERRGQGCGRALLRAAMPQLAQRGGSALWCNARVGAVGFYRTEGFEIVGDEFEIPDVGPHFLMRRPLVPQG